MSRTEWLDRPDADARRRRGGAGGLSRLLSCRRGVSGAVEPLAGRGGAYRKAVTRLPTQFIRLADGDELTIGGYDWDLIAVEGHAAEQICLYCEGLGLLISGDQVLPVISPNVSVWPSEPESDPLGRFIVSLEKFEDLPEEDACAAVAPLAVPWPARPDRAVAGPPRRAPRRSPQRLLEPSTAVEVTRILFPRALDQHQMLFAIGEALAHLNGLMKVGLIRRTTGANGRLALRRGVSGPGCRVAGLLAGRSSCLRQTSFSTVRGDGGCRWRRSSSRAAAVRPCGAAGPAVRTGAGLRPVRPLLHLHQGHLRRRPHRPQPDRAWDPGRNCRFDFTGLGHSDGEFANTDSLLQCRRPEGCGGAHARGAGGAVDPDRPQPGRRGRSGRRRRGAGGRGRGDHRRALRSGPCRAPIRSAIARRSSARAKPRSAGRTALSDPQAVPGRYRRTEPAGADRCAAQGASGLPRAARCDRRDRQCRADLQAAKHPKSFVSLDDADHLLSRREDADYVADVLAAW